MTATCDLCGTVLTKKPLGERRNFCAECRWQGRNYFLKQAERQGRWWLNYRERGES
jgi:hypothetical protein